MANRVFIAGNWKMNTTLDEARALAKDVVEAVGSVGDVDVAVCPPYTNLQAVAEVIKDSNVKLGAQDVHWEEKGAFTGKVSCAMLKSVGVTYVIIGHSEQRSYFNETDETVNKKTKAVLASGLLPIVCVGETLEERKSGSMDAVIEKQVKGAFGGISAEDASKCTVAYEPVWAIGTGETATPQQANEAHIFIRKIISELFGKETADTIRIQYGGSMKPGNAKSLLEESDVDGGLIGGAALKASDFAGIVKPK
ncbi:triose-phosphate isomerase [Chitinispirillales bacterium ANBcel5]|uniref:triose-phosphate isomerase n=1 Tax=Cellulosispirillum alkaliphilum TaxID=3039283 RepID=UPI002A4FB087|nr:triose-phosphate isomerase [Chitinispirillales bacterium ANBcel5]